MVACATDNQLVVEFLAKRFPKAVDWKNKQGLTGLVIAARVGNEGCVMVLLETVGESVDVDACDLNGNTALHASSPHFT